MSNNALHVQKFTLKYFNFLVTEFNFTLDESSNNYYSETLEISISADLLEPIVTLWFKSEPEFTRINFKWYVYFLEESDRLQSSRLGPTLDANFAYFASLLQKHLPAILDGNLNLLLQVLQFFIERSVKDMRMSREQLAAQFQSYKLRYEYAKERDINWDL